MNLGEQLEHGTAADSSRHVSEKERLRGRIQAIIKEERARVFPEGARSVVFDRLRDRVEAEP